MAVRNFNLGTVSAQAAGGWFDTQAGGEVWSLVVIGPFVGTITIEGSNQSGGPAAPFNGISITAPGTYVLLMMAPFVRYNCTAYTSGTPIVLLHTRSSVT